MMSSAEAAAVPPRPQEQLLIELLPELTGGPLLCTSPGLAQFAVQAALVDSSRTVRCVFLDLYQAEQARATGATMANLSLDCAADFPDETFAVAALPLSSTGDAELTRELLQEACQQLAPGGLLAATTDNADDRWLQEEMQKLLGRVTRRTSPLGATYLGRLQQPLKKRKRFAAEFVFRDGPFGGSPFQDNCRLIRAYSRPGVFAHRRIDPGARQVLAAMDVHPGDRVLDIGCGSGVLSLAAAQRAEGVHVLALDSHTRAIQCVRRGAELNGLTNITAELNSDGRLGEPGTFQLALGNPPYYANFRIAEHFLQTAHAALAPGGRALFVTKQPNWYADHMPDLFDNVELFESKSYWLARGIRG